MPWWPMGKSTPDYSCIRKYLTLKTSYASEVSLYFSKYYNFKLSAELNIGIGTYIVIL